MAENKDNKKDNLFHWNFDLKETDSDFTDVEYTPDVIPVSKGQDDIKPFIFVDGNYKSDTSPSAAPKKAPAGGEAAADREVAPRPAARRTWRSAASQNGEKYIDKRKNPIKWKPILIAAAAVAVIALLLIIFWPRNNNKQSDWVLNEDEKITELINTYFKAIKEHDTTTLKTILVPEAKPNSVAIQLRAKLYEAFQNIKIYTYPGMKKNETALLVTYDIKYVNIKTVFPKADWFYVRPDSDGNMRLLTHDELYSEYEAAEAAAKAAGKEEAETTAYSYMANAYKDSEDIQAVCNKITADAENALKSDAVLNEYYLLWQQGGYSTPPDPSSVSPTDPTSPSVTTPAVPDTTSVIVPSDEKPVDYKVFVKGIAVRMRSTPDTTSLDNVIAAFDTGHYLLVVGELDGWLHVKDILTDNGIGGSQNTTGLEGYVSDQLVTKYYTDLNN